MPVDVFGKLGSVLVGIKDMKAASIKSKTEWRFLGVAFEDAHDHEATGSIGCCCFFLGLLDGDVGSINSEDLEASLRQPNCVRAGSASDFQRLAGFDWRRGHGVDDVEVGFANVQRWGSFCVCVTEMICG